MGVLGHGIRRSTRMRLIQKLGNFGYYVAVVFLVILYVTTFNDVFKSRQLVSAKTKRNVRGLHHHQTTPCIPLRNSSMSSAYKTLPPHCFPFVIENPDGCSNSQPIYNLIIVYSNPLDTQTRTAIRKTWGNKEMLKSNRAELFFVLGRAVNHSSQLLVNEEFKAYQDIIQSDFEDTYENLVYKALTAIRWYWLHCRHADYMLKVDSDTFVNFEAVNDLIRNHLPSANYRFLGCRINHSPVLRPGTVCWRWCIPEEDYKPDQYPPFCDGAFYIASRAALDVLYKTALSTPLWWIEDVYLTGLVKERSGNIEFRDLRGCYTKSARSMIMNLWNNPKSLCFGTLRYLGQMYDIWNALNGKVDPKLLQVARLSHDINLQFGYH